MIRDLLLNILITLSIIFTTVYPYDQLRKPLDPEVNLDTIGIIEHWGYVGERHNVTTEDGYILEMHRIPHPKYNQTDYDRPVIFLQHGVESSSADWVTNLPTQSAAFIFADAGFDVWMGNFRGNSYSLNHETLSVRDWKFWQFSWDEMGEYDLKAMIDKVINVTGRERIFFLGHSQGTTTAFAKFSTDPILAEKIEHFFALAPVASLNNIDGALKYIAPFTREIKFITAVAGYNEFLPNDAFVKFLAENVCRSQIFDPLCSNLLFLVGGPSTNQLNMTRLPVYFTHTPDGTSTKNIVHFGQMVNSGKFQKYDYGFFGNIFHYGQYQTPVYDVTRMNVSTTLFWGDQDFLADSVDVKQYLIPKMQNLKGTYELNDFNHLDFIWGLRAASEVYSIILQLMQK